MKKIVLSLMGVAVACGIGCIDIHAVGSTVEGSTVKKSTTECVIKTVPTTRTAAEKREQGLLRNLHRVNVNGNPVGRETQDPQEIMKLVRKHMGKVIHIERRAALNEKRFDVDTANVGLRTEGEQAGMFEKALCVQCNGVNYYEGFHPEFIATAVEECLNRAVHVQKNIQLVIKPVSMCK